MAKIKAGDKVEIKTKDDAYKGALIERPGILKGDFLVLKLDNGYNIGIDKKKITKTKLIKPADKKDIKHKKIKQDVKLPKVSILSFGGTISSRVDYQTGGVYADYTAEDFLEMYPELAGIANIKARKVKSIMSEDLDFEAWAEMAKVAEEEIRAGASGIIITQGTDTMHFSSAAVSFMLKDLNVPVIFTAAQRSIDRGSSDAYMNLVCSVIAAAKSDCAEVMTCMHATSSDDYCFLIRGTKVRKMHTSRRDAFRPINDIPIAKVFPDNKIEYMSKDYNKISDSKVSADTKAEPKVGIIFAYPGADPGVIDYYVDKGYKGLVISATALGHVPTENKKSSFIAALKKANEKGVAVVIASQTLYGRVHPYVYTNLRKLSVELGCIFADDMTPETSYVKLAWVLAHAKSLDEVKEMMQNGLRGEIRERNLPCMFLY